MARLNRLSRISDKSLPNPPSAEPKLVAFKIKIKNPAPQRQLSLLTISVILNTLLWSSITCAILALFQIASDSEDHSNILPGVLTLVSVSRTCPPYRSSTDCPGYRYGCVHDCPYNVLCQAKSSYLSATRPCHYQKDNLHYQSLGGLIVRLVAVDCRMGHDSGSQKA